MDTSASIFPDASPMALLALVVHAGLPVIVFPIDTFEVSSLAICEVPLVLFPADVYYVT